MTQNSRREIPQFNTPIVETHCHLDYLDSQTLSETLDDAFALQCAAVIRQNCAGVLAGFTGMTHYRRA